MEKELAYTDDLYNLSLINIVHPVGDIMFLNSTTDPNKLYPGTTWIKIEGRMLIGKASSGTFKTLGATGGEETHKLTISEMPKHDHSGVFGYDNTKITNTGLGDTYITPSGNQFLWASDTDNGTHWMSTPYTGSSAAHNNMPPYKVVNIWERTE